MLQRFALAEWTQFGLVLFDVTEHGLWIVLCELAQSPTDRFAEEKFLRGQGGLDAREKQLQIRRFAKEHLTDDRCAALPQIGRATPSEHGFSHRSGVGRQQRPDAVLG